jgi:transposase
MGEGVALQEIIGTDKRNSQFTICRGGSSAAGKIYVFFGAELLEVVSENKSDPDFKMMVARLYNAGVKAKPLTEQFGVARTTMKRWGDALRGNDLEELVRVFGGPGPPRKLTVEIQEFVQVRSRDVYARTRYNYSALIRGEIREIFKVELSGESLHPLFKQLKEEFKHGNQESPESPEDQATIRVSGCDSEAVDEHEEVGASVSEAFTSAEMTPSPQEGGADRDGDNRRESLVCEEEERRAFFCHHVGIPLLGAALAQLRGCVRAGTE